MSAVLMAELLIMRAEFTLGLTPSSPSPTLHLFVNELTPECTDSTGEYEECTLAGYAAVPLVPANWSCSQSACVETCTYPLITFTFTNGGETIYGHYVTDGASGPLLWAEAWTVPFAVPAAGGSVQVTLQWVDKQCP
jgi:hypothetical protein